MTVDDRSATLTLEDLQAADPRLTVEYVGHYDAYVFFLDAPRDQVEAHLPPIGITLAPQNLTPPDRHPLVFMAGRQSDVRPRAVRKDAVAGLKQYGLTMNYLELIVAVPFVRRVGNPATYTELVCSTRLVLDHYGPTMLGWLCGFPKIVGQISWSASNYTATTLQGDPLFESKLQDYGPIDQPSQFANFALVRPIFEQLHIGSLLQVAVVCTQLDFQMSCVAKINAIQGKAQIDSRLCSIAAGNHTIKGIDQQQLGAFRLTTTWLLAPYQHCDCDQSALVG
ncbi:MAG: hypothetical protein K2Y37_20045 [Pirellulales bacterium]|nr:hypothetical protein [Pirellulales bacterium]